MDEIKTHPFFKGIDWKTIRAKKSPYCPDLKSDEDCTRFDNFDEEEPFYPNEEKRSRKVRKDINFVGYTYKKDVED